MSRAFTREEDTEAALADIGERPVSTNRNLVTREGLAAIEAEIAELRAAFARAEAEGDRERIARVARDLRYWTARRETAEPVEPDAGEGVVRFGMRVMVEGEDGERREWTIVGEDEADAAIGKISHVSPMARALFGKGVDDVAIVNGKEWEIVSLNA